MQFSTEFKALNLKSRDYEIEGRKGTSHKAQILVANESDNSLEVLTVKVDPKVKLEPNENYTGNFEVREVTNKSGYKSFDLRLLYVE